MADSKLHVQGKPALSIPSHSRESRNTLYACICLNFNLSTWHFLEGAQCLLFGCCVYNVSKHSSFLFRLKENLQKHKKSNKNVTFSRSKLICCRVASKCFCFQVHCMVLFWEWHSSGVPASVPILLYSRCFSLLQHEIQ